MAHRSHIPKFGNCDGDNVPYTAYFENARKEKAGGVTINPNDPEQNPEAFNIGRPTAAAGSSRASHAAPALLRLSHDDKIDAPRKHVHQRNIHGQPKIATSESNSTDKSPSDSSASTVLKPSHRRKKSDRNKHASDSRIPPASPGRRQPKYSADDFSVRSVSVPKFGQWDEKDPRSAEGFTVIFNKVEEKQIAAAKSPPCHHNRPSTTIRLTRTRSRDHGGFAACFEEQKYGYAFSFPNQ